MRNEKYKNSKEIKAKRQNYIFSESRAITLITLVITIVLLIILAGIMINIGLGENGLFTRAKEARDKYLVAEKGEEQILNELYKQLGIEGELPENTQQTEAGKIVRLPASWATETMRQVSTTNGNEVTSVTKVSTVYAVAVGNGETVPVPYGFWYVGGNLETGVVISDKEEDSFKKNGRDMSGHSDAINLKGNQFVFIPCSEENYKKTNWGQGTVTNRSDSYWDTTVDKVGKIQTQKYGGFYVGRYESGLAETINEFTTEQQNTTLNQIYNNIGIPQIKAGKVPWIFIDWTHSYQNSESMYNTKYVSSGLITGTQWDVMLNKINSIKNKDGSEKYSLTDSYSWGNYKNNSVDYTGRIALIRNSTYLEPFGEITTGKTTAYSDSISAGQLLTTGASEQTKAYNIYDVAGNVWEWTEEVSYRGGNVATEYRVCRAGGFFEKAFDLPACYRSGGGTTAKTYANVGFRVVLYMK